MTRFSFKTHVQKAKNKIEHLTQPDIVLIVVAIIFPPAAVAMIAGCHMEVLINVSLVPISYSV